MLKRLLSAPSKTIASAAILISSTTLVSRLIGILRDRAINHYFGLGAVTDAYDAAFKIPDFLYNLLIVGALSTAFIPLFTGLYQKDEDKKEAWRFASNILNIAGVILIVASGIGIACTPWIAKAMAIGFDQYRLDLTADFMRIIFISPVLLGISMVLGGILQSLRQYVIYAFAPILYNLGIIVGATLLAPSLGPTGIAWGVALGALLHMATQWYGAHQAGFRWYKIFKFRDPNVRTVGRLMIPRTMGLALVQTNTVLITSLASTLSMGSVRAYNLANNIQGVPTGIIGIPFALAVFPLLSAAAAGNNTDDFRRLVSTTTRQVIFLLVPISILFLMLRAQIVRVLYGTGAFGWGATITVADALAFFALGIIAQSLIPLLARAFYALSDTKTPFHLSILAEGVTLSLALLFTRPELGIAQRLFSQHPVAALALATSIGSTVNTILLYIGLQKKLQGLHGSELLVLIYKTAAAGLAMGIAVQLLKYPLSLVGDLTRWWGVLLQGFVSGIVGLFIYLGVCYGLKVPELGIMIDGFRKRYLKPKVVQAVDDGSSV